MQLRCVVHPLAPKRCCYATNGSYSWWAYPEQHLHYVNRRLKTHSLHGLLEKVPPSSASHCLDPLLPLYRQWVKVSKVLSRELRSQPITCTSPSPIAATNNGNLSPGFAPNGCDQSKLQSTHHVPKYIHPGTCPLWEI
jgi:hypothetical protein